MQEKLVQWLQQCPCWQAVSQLQYDYNAAGLGSAGLYYCGEEVVEQRKDLLGIVTLRMRSRYRLHRSVAAQPDTGSNSAWLLQFQQWVQQQNALGLLPPFGEEPRVTAERGKLVRSLPSGQAQYTVELTVEYTKRYEP